jgi:hypothetical protein
MLEDVTARLASFGYTVTENDAFMLTFIIQKVENHIKSECNISTIPDELTNIVVDMVVGEFLLNKKSIGQLTGFNLSAAVKQIQEGDTNISFSGEMSPEQRLDALIDYLMNYGKGKLVSYRSIRW